MVLTHEFLDKTLLSIQVSPEFCRDLDELVALVAHFHQLVLQTAQLLLKFINPLRLSNDGPLHNTVVLVGHPAVLQLVPDFGDHGLHVDLHLVYLVLQTVIFISEGLELLLLGAGSLWLLEPIACAFVCTHEVPWHLAHAHCLVVALHEFALHLLEAVVQRLLLEVRLHKGLHVG